MSVDFTKTASRTFGLSQNLILLAFACALFSSAMLMFGIQPLFAKFVLPRLGGSPAVWSVALVFFQGILVLGYAYAHLLTKLTQPRTAAMIHTAVMLAAIACLPIAYPEGWTEVPATNVPFWVLSLFAVGVGFPAFAISANAPLLQSWFSRTGHRHAADPYFLYGASNIGSFIGLMAYPFILEPVFQLQTQSLVWSGGFVILAAMIGICGFIVAQLCTTSNNTAADGQSAAQATSIKAAPVTWTERFTWMALAMIPSGLLVGVTAYITTDLASAPFLWIIPLAMFLATFVITFQRTPVISHARIRQLHVLIVAPVAVLLVSPFMSGLLSLVVHLAVFFICAMLCHGELVRRRPASVHLTEFYMLMSIGGVMGGLFASLIAPNIFSTIHEYPILLAATFLCNPLIWNKANKLSLQKDWPLAVLALLVVGMFVPLLTDFIHWAWFSGIVIFTISAYLLRNNPRAQAAAVASGMFLVALYQPYSDELVRVRSFFGVSSVVSADNGRAHVLKHGTTDHGREIRLDASGNRLESRPEGTRYYHQRGAIVAAFDAIRQKSGRIDDAMIVGLGAGSMACQRREGERWSYVEIDPEVIKLARDPKYFSFLEKCGESEGVILADGRLALEKARNAQFDLILMDAFSSDAIPVHLLTREAMALYRTKLKQDGAMVLHISNRHMELRSVVDAMAKAEGLVAYFNDRAGPGWPTDESKYEADASVAVVAANMQALGGILDDERWQPLKAENLPEAWTDSYSNIIGAIWRKKTSTD